MKKITLPYIPQRNIERGIMIETGDSSLEYMEIVAGQVEYILPERNTFQVYVFTPLATETE